MLTIRENRLAKVLRDLVAILDAIPEEPPEKEDEEADESDVKDHLKNALFVMKAHHDVFKANQKYKRGRCAGAAPSRKKETQYALDPLCPRSLCGQRPPQPRTPGRNTAIPSTPSPLPFRSSLRSKRRPIKQSITARFRRGNERTAPMLSDPLYCLRTLAELSLHCADSPKNEAALPFQPCQDGRHEAVMLGPVVNPMIIANASAETCFPPKSSVTRPGSYARSSIATGFPARSNLTARSGE